MHHSRPEPADLPARIGRAMLFGAWMVALALLAVLFNAVLERQRNPNPAPQMRQEGNGIRQVVLQRNRFGQYVANGAINAVPVRFLVDTGATDVALPLALAQRLKLPLRPGGTAMTANGTVQTWETRLDRVDLGGLVVRDVRASVLPRLPGEDVLLGMSYLQHLELLQRGATLTLRAHAGF